MSLAALRKAYEHLDQIPVPTADAQLIMSKVSDALAEAQLEFYDAFDTDMPAEGWNDLAQFTRRTRALIKRAAGQEVGWVRRQTSFLTSAQDLISAASSHARLIGHVEQLSDRGSSISQDNAALLPSLRDVRKALEDYRAAVVKLLG